MRKIFFKKWHPQVTHDLNTLMGPKLLFHFKECFCYFPSLQICKQTPVLLSFNSAFDKVTFPIFEYLKMQLVDAKLNLSVILLHRLLHFITIYVVIHFNSDR